MYTKCASIKCECSLISELPTSNKKKGKGHGDLERAYKTNLIPR